MRFVYFELFASSAVDVQRMVHVNKSRGILKIIVEQILILLSGLLIAF